MKVLTTEAQQDLQDLLGNFSEQSNIELQNRVRYWLTELKPKRVRKKVLTQAIDTV